MSTCHNAGEPIEVELVEGPRPGTLRCPDCGQVLDAETLAPLDKED